MSKLSVVMVVGGVILALGSGLAQASMQSEIAYTKGLSHIQEGKWEQAAGEFCTIRPADPEWGDAQYYLGVSYNQLEEYDQAVDVLQPLVEKEPLFSEARAELAYALSRLGKEAEARREAERVRGLEVAPGAEEEELPEHMKRRFYRFYLTTGTQYDSNVMLAPSDEHLSQNIEGEWGFRQNFLGYGEVAPWILPETQVGGSYLFYHSYNFDIDLIDRSHEPSDYNFQDHRFDLFMAQVLGNALFRLPYTLDIFLKGDGLDRYWTGHKVEPSVTYSASRLLRLKGSFRFRSDGYNAVPDQPQQNQDAKNISFGIDPSVLFHEGKWGHFNVGYRLEFNLADGDDWDYLGNRFEGNLKFKPATHFLTIHGSFHWRKFSNLNSLSNLERDDKELSIGGSVGREGKMLYYSISVTYITNSSNIEEYDYNRFLGSVMLGFNI